MAQYSSLAPYYDLLTTDVNYNSWADYYMKIFERENIQVKSILDLACGTGTLSYILAERGFEVIGVDSSADMLSEAFAKSAESKAEVLPMFINQSMEGLDLYGTVDAVVCCLDGINYLHGIDNVLAAFRRVQLFLEPGGIFIFDVNTPKKLRDLDGQVFIDEKEGVYCVWRSEYDGKERACYYGIDIFTQQGRHWHRDFEEHIEYSYTVEELEAALKKANFEDVHVYGELKLENPSEDEKRIFITARKKK